MFPSPSDKEGVVRKDSSSIGNEVADEQESPVGKENNTVMNSREFTDEQDQPTAPATYSPQPSQNNRKYDEDGESARRIVTPQDVKKWFQRHNWSGDPFTFSIEPSLLVGYTEQTNQLLCTIEEKHKLFLVIGPTGSGKTTMLKWACERLADKDYITLFISKPPASAEEFVEIFNDRFQIPWYKRPFTPHIKTIYQMPAFLENRIKGKHLVVMCDEIHEARPDILEWFRVLTDNVSNMSLIVAGLPTFNETIKEKLETFEKRIISKIELISLTKKEMREMIQKRIEHVGGTGISPFSEEAMGYVFNQTGGFPREILRICDDLLNLAINLNVDALTKENIERYHAPTASHHFAEKSSPMDMEGAAVESEEEYRPVSMNVFENMSPLQMRILNILAEKDTTPGAIANTFDLGKYKSRQHAVRSINNILVRMMQDDYVRRIRRGRTFAYTLSPRIKTLLVRR